MPVNVAFSKFFTGTFSAKFTGKWMPARALFGPPYGHYSRFTGASFGKCSRALFAVLGYFFLKTNKNAGLSMFLRPFPISRFTGTFSKFNGIFFNVSGTFKVDGKFFAVHGHFIGCTGKVFPKFHGQMYLVHGHICKIVYGHFFEVHGRKKNVLVQIWRLLSFH